MNAKVRSVEQMVEQQVNRWQLLKKKAVEEAFSPVITLSREPGSGGQIVAAKVAADLSYDMFHQEVIHKMAQSANTSVRFLESLDEKGLNTLEESISSLVNERHLWPDQYMRHLMKIIGTIGRYGGAVIVGRGANFVLPEGKRLRVRVVAPRDHRIAQVAATYEITADEARRRILRTEANRKAFVRKYFYADIADPMNYDMLVNSGALGIERAAAAIMAAVADTG